MANILETYFDKLFAGRGVLPKDKFPDEYKDAKLAYTDISGRSCIQLAYGIYKKRTGGYILRIVDGDYLNSTKKYPVQESHHPDLTQLWIVMLRNVVSGSTGCLDLYFEFTTWLNIIEAESVTAPDNAVRILNAVALLPDWQERLDEYKAKHRY